MSELDDQIALYRSQLEHHPEEHSNRPSLLHDLSVSLNERFDQGGDIADLEEALSLERSALEFYPPGHSAWASSLSNLASCLGTRFEQLGKLSDLEEAISLEQSALEHFPPGHRKRPISLGNIAGYLHTRFEELGKLSDLEEAIALERSALECFPPGHRERPISLGNIASYLYSRFEQLGELSDLQEAISLERSALEHFPPGHPERPISLGSIANYLHTRYEQLGKLSDLEEAISLERSALEYLPPGHRERPLSLGNIANYLHSSFLRLGRLSDLEEAISLERSALKHFPPGHRQRPISLGNIANYLHSRFEQLGRLSDLEEALAFQRSALELRPPGHPDRGISLGSVANYLHTRFEQLGRLSDLEEALSLERSALELFPPGHMERPISLGSIAEYLHSRFEELGKLSDLEEALSLQYSALELRPPGHPDRPMSLGNIASYLHSRFERLGKLSDLEEALSLERNALEHFPLGHPERPVSLGSIASYLYSRFKQLGTLSDLEEAISLVRSALELRPPGHPFRASSLGDLARYLHALSKRSPIHNTGALDEAFNLYSELSKLSETVSSADLDCSKQWIKAAEKYDHPTTVLAYQTFLRLSVHHLAVLSSLPQNLPLLKQLVTSVAVDAFSACLRHRNPIHAVELLEQGRGVFWNQLIRLRSPVDDVAASGEMGRELADKFVQLTSLLHRLHDVPSNEESVHDRAIRLNVELQDVVAHIRKLDGFSRFLLPPRFLDLRVAAACGPVIVVNASRYSCDALILLRDRDPVHVILPIAKARVSELSLRLGSLTSRTRFMDVTRGMMILLRELWDDVVSPVVNVLQEICPRRSRIWWCPTAEFSLLPLHAAGPYRKDQPMLSDLYISSYTPTITALIRARQNSSSDPPAGQPRFLIVGQAQAPGQTQLASVTTELSKTSRRVGSLAAVTCVQGRHANVGTVGDALYEHEFVHFACHGIPDQKRPFESGFALGDGLLRVEDIMRYYLRNAKFAYLSACHTTVGDEESPDEVIHLAAAMQFAGFRSVIGTMWAVDDGHTEEITSRFYDHMMNECGRLDHTHAALALHRTVRSIRPSEVPLDQRILYIHIGA